MMVFELWTTLSSSIGKIEDDGKTEDIVSSPDSLSFVTGEEGWL